MDASKRKTKIIRGRMTFSPHIHYIQIESLNYEQVIGGYRLMSFELSHRVNKREVNLLT